MKVEFYQDENNRVWFFNAQDIWIRENITRDDILFPKAKTLQDLGAFHHDYSSHKMPTKVD